MSQSMEPKIVNPDPKYSRVSLIEPTTLGYIHAAAEVSPQPGPDPIITRRRDKFELLSRLKVLAHRLEQLESVEKATVFDAVAIPPTSRFSSYLKERADSIHLARFDVVVLIETKSPEDAREVQQTPAYRALLDALESEARDMHVMVGRNAKRVGDVDKTRDGLFLFNYFVADDANVALELWDYLAGWYKVEIGLDNSTLVVPLEDEESDYLAINSARWDVGLPRFLFRQFSKKSFRTYVQANLEANRVGAMPILYRLADTPHRPGAAPGAPGGRGGWAGSSLCPEQDAPEEIFRSGQGHAARSPRVVVGEGFEKDTKEQNAGLAQAECDKRG